MDSGIAELSGGSTSPPQSYRSDINDNNIPGLLFDHLIYVM